MLPALKRWAISCRLAGRDSGVERAGVGSWVVGCCSIRLDPAFATAGGKQGPSAALGMTALETKVDFHIDHDPNGMTILGRGVETPLLDGFDCLLVQTHSERPLHPDILRQALLIDD